MKLIVLTLIASACLADQVCYVKGTNTAGASCFTLPAGAMSVLNAAVAGEKQTDGLTPKFKNIPDLINQIVAATVKALAQGSYPPNAIQTQQSNIAAAKSAIETVLGMVGTPPANPPDAN